VQTIKQIAKAHGVTDRTVRSWLKSARKELGSDCIGCYEDGRLVFTADEVETLAGYGRVSTPGAVPVPDVIEVDIEPAMELQPVQQQAPALIAFHVENLTIQTNQTDTTALDMQADAFQGLTQQAFGAIAAHLKDDLIGMVRTAKSQNRHGVLGAQAAASTAAIKEL
jgi:hypothetical protein